MRGTHFSHPLVQRFLAVAQADAAGVSAALRLPLQHVGQGDLATRCGMGTLAAGTVQAGDAVRVLPAGVQTRVQTVQVVGDTVTVTLADDVALQPGAMLVAAEAPPEVADQFAARLLWRSERAMTPGRQYLMQMACQEVTATITDIKYREDGCNGIQIPAKVLAQDETAFVNLATSTPVVFEPYEVNQVLGGFVLLDKQTHELVGVGRIEFALRRASNVHWQALEVNKAARAAHKQQRPRCIWFTGLSGSGKSTIANLLEKRLHAEGRHTYLLDGDNVRHGLNRDLGFTEADRVENIRRVAEVAKLMVDAGLMVLVSFISPFRSERRMARELFAEGEFVEVFVDTPLEECERRDVKGLYAKARQGALKNFTGIDSPYEAPQAPEVHVRTTHLSPAEAAEEVLQRLERR